MYDARHENRVGNREGLIVVKSSEFRRLAQAALDYAAENRGSIVPPRGYDMDDLVLYLTDFAEVDSAYINREALEMAREQIEGEV